LGQQTRAVQSAESVFQRQILMSVMTFFDATLVQALIANYGYAAVFVVVMLESSGLPVPVETVLVCASVYAASRNGLSIGAIIGVAACGAILGDNIGFWVGGFGRSTRLMKRGLWFKPSGHSQRARRAIWTNWRTEEAISEWKHNQQQRHFSRKDRWFSHIRSAGA
jgi:membrane protein DedA with SNARE-associated domain